MLSARGITTHVLPADATLADIRAIGADGVFLSNGPGDPATADASVALTEQVLQAGIPFFGICFGNQILGRALGFGTYKLKFGHRGINQPVQDHATGRVLVTGAEPRLRGGRAARGDRARLRTAGPGSPSPA